MNPAQKFIDILYPPRCAICRSFLPKGSRKNGDAVRGVCSSCREDFHPLRSPCCTVCARPFVPGTGRDHLCENCLRRRPFFHVLGAPYLYEGAFQDAIHLFKYGKRSDLAAFLGPLLASFVRKWEPAEGVSLVVPVPLHKKRLKERGFNQSKLLAHYVAKELKADLDFLSLRRVKYTLPQTGLGKKERRKNVRKAFAVKRPERIYGKTVLVVDDVATTGNTLNECARELIRGGAERIAALVVARTPNPAF
jgi:ComF family protein